MSTVTTVTRKCDYCDLTINPKAKYVAAGTYGADFHALCWKKIGGREVAKLLGLDECNWAVHDGTDALPELTGRAWAYYALGETPGTLNAEELRIVETEGQP